MPWKTRYKEIYIRGTNRIEQVIHEWGYITDAVVKANFGLEKKKGKTEKKTNENKHSKATYQESEQSVRWESCYFFVERGRVKAQVSQEKAIAIFLFTRGTASTKEK